MGMVEKAEMLATKWHAGQNRWGGEDYITHPEAVAKCVDDCGGSERSVALAWLHDTVEDTSASICDIVAHFDNEMGVMVRVLSRNSKENYFDYIMRIGLCGDIRIISVKVADLTHNMIGIKEGSMLDKYRFAAFYLSMQLINQ